MSCYDIQPELKLKSGSLKIDYYVEMWGGAWRKYFLFSHEWNYVTRIF